MHRLLLLFAVLLQTLPLSLNASVSSVPSCCVYTQNSILERKGDFKPMPVGSRKRWATCTGATWFHDNYLAVLNLYGNKITTYKFEADKNRFDLLQEIGNEDGMNMRWPENLTASPDGTLIAVAPSMPNSGINIYKVDLELHTIHPTPTLTIPTNHCLIHNIKFSPNGDYLATASFDNDMAVCIYKISKQSSTISAKLVSNIQNKFTGLKTKGLSFTKNSRFLVVSYCLSINDSNRRENVIVTYKFDSATGQIGDMVSKKENPLYTEDVAMLNDDKELIVSDQAADELVLFSFDPTTGEIGERIDKIKNPDADLSFPHGIGVSQDGKYLVVCNYGDDKFNLYEVTP